MDALGLAKARSTSDQREGAEEMTDKTNEGPKKDPRAHTELRRQDKTKADGEPAATRLKPRTPEDRLPVDGTDDDLFNDMPV
jgi:hypothetical protein